MMIGFAIMVLLSLFEDDIMKLWDYEHSVEQYNSSGGTSKQTVLQQIQMLKKWVSEL